MSEPVTRWRSLQICKDCWYLHNPARRPVRIKEPDVVECALCEKLTESGIYVRVMVAYFPVNE